MKVRGKRKRKEEREGEGMGKGEREGERKGKGGGGGEEENISHTITSLHLLLSFRSPQLPNHSVSLYNFFL